jgi:exodeoxyribonuclease-3
MAARDFHVYSWNVNGLRAIVNKGFSEWFQKVRPDVLGVQEVRATLEQLPEEVTKRQGYGCHVVAAERKGYSGVGLWARGTAKFSVPLLGRPELDNEGRLVEVRLGALRVVSGYFPYGNGKERDNSRVPHKLAFYDLLRKKLAQGARDGERILVMGDFNTAPEAIDLARPKQNLKTSGFLQEERDTFAVWLKEGWVDTFRHLVPEPGHYSWWSQRAGVREKNIGWRIDMIMASPGAAEYLKSAAIHPEVLGSDHCPISVRLDRRILAP